MGMQISMIRTSGFSLAVALSRDWPSCTAPMTSNAGSRKFVAISKKFALSSARSIRAWLKLTYFDERGNQHPQRDRMHAT